MAGFINKIIRYSKTPVGTVVLACVYAIMLILVLIFYTGNGAFIYEAF